MLLMNMRNIKLLMYRFLSVAFGRNKLARSPVNSITNNSQTQPNLTVILTQYKRKNLAKQLESVFKQSLVADKVIVFQNEKHVDISELISFYKIEHVLSSHNTKFFGRFAFCLSLNSNYFIVLDDDIVPGPKCFENYINECNRLSGIIGGNGRIAELNINKNALHAPPDTGIRTQSRLVDFVGHMWVFKKEWLYDMFSIPPSTLDTGEDMHFCFSAKLKSGINSYACKQEDPSESSDISNGRHATDQHSSYKKTSSELRISVERYFQTLGLQFIDEN